MHATIVAHVSDPIPTFREKPNGRLHANIRIRNDKSRLIKIMAAATPVPTTSQENNEKRLKSLSGAFQQNRTQKLLSPKTILTLSQKIAFWTILSGIREIAFRISLPEN